MQDIIFILKTGDEEFIEAIFDNTDDLRNYIDAFQDADKNIDYSVEMKYLNPSYGDETDPDIATQFSIRI